MIKKLTLACFLFCLTVKTHAQSIISVGSTSVICDTLVSGIDIPWEILYGPDKHIWMTERKGVVSRINPVTKVKTTILDHTATVYDIAESGMLGMVLHPDFPTVSEVFIAYTFGGNNIVHERLSKFTYNNGTLGNEQILIDSIPGNSFHNGARLLFMQDKTLLMTTGEAGNVSLSQNMNSLNGKILRVKTDGSVPSDNPFPGSYIYTSGHRNPQGLTMGPNGIIYTTEHGPSNDDEFQIVEKGRNYGWPDVEGFCNLPAEITFCNANNVKEPLVNWSPTIAPADLVYYYNPAFPELHERFIMTVLKDKKIVAVKLDAAGTSYVSQSSYLTNMFGRLRDVCIGSSQEIYLATNGANSFNNNPNTHSIIVLKPATTVGIASHKNNLAIKVYPTLVKENIHITSSAGEYMLTVTDLCGKICRKECFTGNYTGNMTDLEEGLYFLTVSGQDTYNQYKIIVTR